MSHSRGRQDVDTAESGGIAAPGDVIELVHDTAGKVGSGTAINGLRPDVSASVELKGTAPLEQL